jgi:ligand-binding sensor domain-containing protein
LASARVFPTDPAVSAGGTIRRSGNEPLEAERISEVLELNSTRFLALLLSFALLAAQAACSDDTTTPEPPPPPPQISTQAAYYEGSTGLPDNDVYSILVTTGGEVWMGTATGISIYPNVNTTTRSGEVINELNGLPNRIVRKMIEYDGRIYVATFGGGVGIYDMGSSTWTTRGTKDGLPDGHVSDVVALPAENRVYMATDLGVGIYNPVLDQITTFTPLDKLVSCVEAIDYGGTFERWYGPRVDMHFEPTDGNLHGITVARGTTTFNMTLANCPLPEARVNDIFYDGVRDVFWVSLATTGLAEVSVPNSTWTFYSTVEGLPSNTVYSVARAADCVWAGTQAGLARLRSDGTWQSYARAGGLQADRVRLVYSDDGERLWLGFVEGGAARVNAASAQ